jgi:hypothetical protein
MAMAMVAAKLTAMALLLAYRPVMLQPNIFNYLYEF